MQVPHIRLVKPYALRGELNTARGTRIYITLPGDVEREIHTAKGATLNTHIDGADTVVLEMYATLEIDYEENRDEEA